MFKDFLKFVEYYGKDKKLKIIFFILISIVAGLLEFVGIGLIYPFLIMIMKPQSAIKIYCIENLFINLLIIGFLIVSIFILKNVLMIICTYLQNKFVIEWKNDVNNMIMNYYLNAPYKKLFENTSSEKIYNVTVLSSQTLETFVLRALVFITNSIIIFLILSLMFLKFSLIALFSIILVALCMIFLNKFFKSKTEILAPKMLEYSLKNNNQVIENIKNLKEIRIFSAEQFFSNKYKQIQKENNYIIFKNAFFANIPPYLVEIILVVALIIIACLITYQNITDSSKIIASYGLIIAVIFRIAPSLNRIQVALNHMNASKNMIKKMNEEYRKYRFDDVLLVNESAEKLEFKKKLELKDVNFSYCQDKPILRGVTLEIEKGEFIGITGLSGAGKTTLADIIMGLLPKDSGSIILDGTEINDKNINKYRKIIGYVPQEMNILEGRYKNNVAWGVKDADIDEYSVIESLKQAQLYDFVEVQGGINSVIKGLSQGQKQRLMIARALYNKPEIIILDEATSSLDVETEKEITQMLTNLKNNQTIITIAHRLTTLKSCDKIIYVKDGEIDGFDTFENLEKQNEDFKNLINISKI